MTRVGFLVYVSAALFPNLNCSGWSLIAMNQVAICSVSACLTHVGQLSG